MRDLLNNIVDAAVTKFGAEYAETRAQTLHKTMLTLKEGRVEAAKQGIENGVALRVLVNGTWGFASVGSLNAEVLTNAVSDACKMAKTASSRQKSPIKLAETKAVEDSVCLKPEKNPSEIQIEDKIKTALAINKTTLSYDKRVRSCTIDYLDLTGNSHFVSSEGTAIDQDKLYVWSRITASAKSKGTFTFSREEIGSTEGYELFDKVTPEKIGMTVAKRAIEQLDAKSPKGGPSPVVLGPDVVGVFVHEAFGHLAEADLALSGGVLSTNLGKKDRLQKWSLFMMMEP